MCKLPTDLTFGLCFGADFGLRDFPPLLQNGLYFQQVSAGGAASGVGSKEVMWTSACFFMICDYGHFQSLLSPA